MSVCPSLLVLALTESSGRSCCVMASFWDALGPRPSRWHGVTPVATTAGIIAVAFSRADRPKYGVREARAVEAVAGEDRCCCGVGDVLGRQPEDDHGGKPA